MNRKTKKALEGSIEKWEKIVSGEGEDSGVINCPLCIMFHRGFLCGKCPVGIKANDNCCMNTPYYEWCEHQEDEHSARFPYKVECDECKELAQKELDFLKSLEDR